MQKMPVFFHNEGTTCFFNAAMQLCLNNPHFRRAMLSPEFTARNNSGFVSVMLQFVRECESHTNPRDAAIGKVKELLPYFPFLAEYVRTHQHGDVMECLDAIYDQLAFPGTRRPNVVTFADSDAARTEACRELREQIRAHCGPLEVVWGVQEQISTCMECKRVVRRELIPFTWVTRIQEQHFMDGVDCDRCGVRGRRELLTRLFESPPGLVVRVNARHLPDGSKDNRIAVMRERVDVTPTKRYCMQSMVYHEGWSFAGGHYVTAVRMSERSPWVLNSDSSCRFAAEGFSIESYKPQCTYAALYMLSSA